MKKKVATFGEIMLRLSPFGNLRFVQADSFEVIYGGGEANVAVSLSNFGIDSYFISKLPNHQIGISAANSLRRYGVNIDNIIWGGDRIGIYFSETGASQRPSIVIYDRANSSIATINQGDIDWKNVLSGMDWFHFTGITPALGDGPAEQTLEAVKVAKEYGIKVSCDLNYRKKLWTPAKAKSIMTELMAYVDILIGNEEDAEKVFNIKAEGVNVEAGALDKDGYRLVAKQLLQRFNLEMVAITLRESHSASNNTWSALLYDGKDFFDSKKYNIYIVDRIGGGDSFCGAFIYAILSNYTPQSSLDFAVAASCLKHTVPGDFNMVGVNEVQSLVEGNASGRVQR